MNLEKLRLFLVDVNKNTYSTGDESLNKKESDKSTTIEYMKGNWRFHDNFFWGEPYGGRVVVFYKNKPVWMMLYHGYFNKNIVPKNIISISSEGPAKYASRSSFLWSKRNE